MNRKRGTLSNMIRVFIQDNTLTTGKGLTGLAYNSANLQITVIRELSATPTIYTGANIEDITTIGTYQAPSTSAKCRFKAIDGTNRPGEYEIHFHDDAGHFAVGDSSKNVQIRVDEITTTALNIAPCLREIDLVAYDEQDATALGTGLALESGGNLAATLADTDELQGLISSSKLPAQVKGIDDMDFPDTQKESIYDKAFEAIADINPALREHFVDGTGNLTPPTDKGLWDVLGIGVSIADLVEDGTFSVINWIAKNFSCKDEPFDLVQGQTFTKPIQFFMYGGDGDLVEEEITVANAWLIFESTIVPLVLDTDYSLALSNDLYGFYHIFTLLNASLITEAMRGNEIKIMIYPNAPPAYPSIFPVRVHEAGATELNATANKDAVIIAIPTPPTVEQIEAEIAEQHGEGQYDAVNDLSALISLIEAIDTSEELQARFDEIKGEGWTDETLKAIKEAIGSGEITAQEVWEYTVRKLTSAYTDEETPRDMAAIGGGTTPAEIWTHGERTLTSFGTLVNDIKTAIWSATERTLTGFGTLIADIWAYATRKLTSRNIGTGENIAREETLEERPTLEEIAEELDTHGTGSWESASPYIIHLDLAISEYDENIKEVKIHTGTTPQLDFVITKDGLAVDIKDKIPYLIVKKTEKTRTTDAIINKAGTVYDTGNIDTESNIIYATRFNLTLEETNALKGKEGSYKGQIDIGPDESVSPKFNVVIERKLRQNDS